MNTDTQTQEALTTSKKEKLNNTEYHKKYLDFLWYLHNKTFSEPVRLNLARECKAHSIDRRLIPVLIKEDILKITAGRKPKYYIWDGHNPDITMAERVVRLTRLSRKKHLKTGKQHINGWKKGRFEKEEEELFVKMVREGYIYPAISRALNRSIYLLRKHKYKLKKRGVDFSPIKPFSYTLFDQGEMPKIETQRKVLEGAKQNSGAKGKKGRKNGFNWCENAESLVDEESFKRHISGKLVDLKTNNY